MNDEPHLIARMANMQSELEDLQKLTHETAKIVHQQVTIAEIRRPSQDQFETETRKSLRELSDEIRKLNALIDRAMWTVKVVRWGAAAVAAAGAAWASTISDVRAWFGK